MSLGKTFVRMDSTLKAPLPAPPLPIPANVALAERALDMLTTARRVPPTDWAAMSPEDRLQVWLEPIACALTSIALTELHPPRRLPGGQHPGVAVRLPAPRSPELASEDAPKAGEE